MKWPGPFFKKFMTVMHKLCKMLSLCQVAHLWNNDQTDAGGPGETEPVEKYPSMLCSHRAPCAGEQNSIL